MAHWVIHQVTERSERAARVQMVLRTELLPGPGHRQPPHGRRGDPVRRNLDRQAMTEPTSRRWRWPATAVATWRTFWFRPQPAYTLGLIRMAFGRGDRLDVSLLPDLYALFGRHGVEPQQPERPMSGVFSRSGPVIMCCLSDGSCCWRLRSH